MNSEDTVKRLQKYQRNIEKIKRSKKMTIEDVIKKALIPMVSMAFCRTSGSQKKEKKKIVTLYEQGALI